MKTITVIVSPTGQTRVETIGFVGAECRAASARLIAALGVKVGEEPTAEMHAGSEHSVTQQQQETQT